jgi:hypothetical protein
MKFRRLAKKGISNPRNVIRALADRGFRHNLAQEINKVYHTRGGWRKYNPNGIDIFAEDWDNLIILDACRYDAFASAKERHNLPGKLESRISRGSRTPEWLYGNFTGKKHFDTVYLSAGAMPYHVGVAESSDPTPHQREYAFDLRVHDLINVWRDPPKGAVSVDDDELKDVLIPADVMVNEALRVADEYPNKRLIIHIMQPHDPYLGPTGQELYDESSSPLCDKLFEDTDISIQDIRQAYRENVDIAVEAADELLTKMKGKTVVSADHGELLFEKSYPIPTTEIKHPNSTYVPELVRVPWLIHDGERRRITAEIPKAEQEESENISDTAIEQLQQLGYRS